MVEGQMCDMEAARREWEGAKGRSNKDEEGNDCDNDDRPRPRPVGGEEALWTGGLPFGFPAPPLLCLTSRSARAPKLNRRAKGVAGLLPLV
jgi:hypothetical protein